MMEADEVLAWVRGLHVAGGSTLNE
jgi:hypothetical protein